MKQRSRVLLAGLALIIVTNALTLIGVAYNRTGEPEAVVVLTERELALPYDYGFESENSGITMRLNWRASHAVYSDPNYYDPWDGMPWLTKEKLAVLGFDVSQPLTSRDAIRRYEKMLPRGAFLVLEFDGDSYRKALEKREAELAEARALLVNNPDKKEFSHRVQEAAERWDEEQRVNSRLFIVDAGLDKQALRARYADRSKYLIMTGEVGIQVLENEGAYSLKGFVRGLHIGAVNVPHVHHSVLEPFLGVDGYQQDLQGPRYAVGLSFGRRLEPWVTALKPLD